MGLELFVKECCSFHCFLMQNRVIMIVEKNMNITLIAIAESRYNNFWWDNLKYLLLFFFCIQK